MCQLYATGQCVEPFKSRRMSLVNFCNLSQLGIEPRSLDSQSNTTHGRCKSQLLPQGSRSVIYVPRLCDIHPSTL